MWLCDITLCHCVILLHKFHPVASLPCKNWFSTSALLLLVSLAQACVSNQSALQGLKQRITDRMGIQFIPILQPKSNYGPENEHNVSPLNAVLNLSVNPQPPPPTHDSNKHVIWTSYDVCGMNIWECISGLKKRPLGYWAAYIHFAVKSAQGSCCTESFSTTNLTLTSALFEWSIITSGILSIHSWWRCSQCVRVQVGICVHSRGQ